MLRTEAIETMIACGGHVGSIVHKEQGWMTIFVHDNAGTSIGRLTFHNDKLEYVKSYKRDHCKTIDETDLIFLRFDCASRTGKVIPQETFWCLWEEAEKKAEEDLAQKRKWREEHPVVSGKKRHRLEGKNPRNILSQLIQELE